MIPETGRRKRTWGNGLGRKKGLRFGEHGLWGVRCLGEKGKKRGSVSWTGASTGLNFGGKKPNRRNTLRFMGKKGYRLLKGGTTKRQRGCQT